MGKASGVLRLLVVGSIVAAGLGLTASPVAAAPTLVVGQATGLLDQQIVTVTGSGFTPGDRYIVAQCLGTGLEGCDLNPPVNTTGALATADAGGTINTALRLSRILEVGDQDVSCAGSGCSIVAVTRTYPRVERARTAIDFAPTGTAPAPPEATFALDATDVRANGVTATWSGSGYLPWFATVPYSFDFDSWFPFDTKDIPLNMLDLLGAGHGAYLAICTSPPSGWPGCERFVGPLDESAIPEISIGRHETVPVASSGTVSAERALPRLWETHSGRIDCAVEDCSFALEQDGAPHSNVVDVAWAPEWAPWPSARAFVVEAYGALMGRGPTASERSVAVAGLTDRSLTGFTFLRRLAGRSGGLRLAELTRLYQAALNRRPDAGGLLYWAAELARTGSITAIAGAFGRTREFRQAFGPGVEHSLAVTRAYQRTLGREPSVAEVRYWVRRLNAGLSRTHMVHLFSRTPEFVAREAGRSEVTAVTVALLGRSPSAEEWDHLSIWGGAGSASARADRAVLDLLGSDELIAAVG